MNNQVKLCIAGVDGYVGKELANLAVQHPYINLVGILAKESDTTSKIPVYTLLQIIHEQPAIDIILLATPALASIEIITTLQQCDIKIIDLSGAFRLPQDALKTWYGLTHTITTLKQGAPYGLSPWHLPNNQQQVLANPGCYATCALMALLPLLQNDLINEQIIIDAKSGISGAGKQANTALMFCEMAENFFPYKIGQHQHTPEILQAITQFTDKSCDITLVTQMLPVVRGLAMTIYLQAKPHLATDAMIATAIDAAYQQAYSYYPLVKYGEINSVNPEQNKPLLSLKNIANTPYTHIAYHVNNGKITLFASIDNLLKGAASQAIENLNALYHFPITTGLTLTGELL